MDFKDVFKKFSDHFPPASPEAATIRLTMSELKKTFSRFFPGDVDDNVLYNLMIESGYQYSPENRSGTINFYWHLKEVKEF